MLSKEKIDALTREFGLAITKDHEETERRSAELNRLFNKWLISICHIKEVEVEDDNTNR